MFKDPNAELNQLKVLNLSKTKISKLPPIPCNLLEFNLSGCSELVELPSTTFLKNLKLLDVSNTPKLAKINHESFQHLTYLRYLNFSNTKVENLPTISNLRNLRQVLLRNCSLLQNLPAMEGVTRLEELDLLGCSALQFQDQYVDNNNICDFGPIRDRLKSNKISRIKYGTKNNSYHRGGVSTSNLYRGCKEKCHMISARNDLRA
ncbi:hypothetical protein LWI29_036689 [Acer saccharum]|uniref:Uncharacterized protein n=1 Tax=Acer saccharum TaxID=4024 RepID=A0AA39SZG0_ACESA|nr:hypothetical protein LWI29_036689 [Acer saccharum]